MDCSFSTWLVGLLLVSAGHISVTVQGDKVRRQLGGGPLQTYSTVPKTSFSCDVHGPGYYADVETQCQVFHICHANVMDSFICPRGTTFNQKVFVCDWNFNVDCGSSADFYSLNNRIGSEMPFRLNGESSPASSRRRARPDVRTPVSSAEVTDQGLRQETASAQTASQSVRQEVNLGQTIGQRVQKKIISAAQRGRQGNVDRPRDGPEVNSGQTDGQGGRQINSSVDQRAQQARLPGETRQGSRADPGVLERPSPAAGQGQVDSSRSREQQGRGRPDSAAGQLTSLSQSTTPAPPPAGDGRRGPAEGASSRPATQPTTSSFSSTLTPNVLTVNLPTFVVAPVVTSAPPQERPPGRSPPSPGGVAAEDRKKTGVQRGKEPGPAPTPAAGTRPGSSPEGRGSYLPEPVEREPAPETGQRAGYLPEPAAPPAGQRAGYLPEAAAEEQAPPPDQRPGYLPIGGGPGRSEAPPSAAGSYLPESGTAPPTRPPTAAGRGFLGGPLPLPPLLPFDLPNSIAAPPSGLQRVDEYSPAPEAAPRQRLPPMNLLPLSNERRPPTGAGRLPSTTESYGVLVDGEQTAPARPLVPTAAGNRQGPGNSLVREEMPAVQNRGDVRGRDEFAARPETETRTDPSLFQYDFDRVRAQIQERLNGVEPFEVPAGRARRPTVAPPVGPPAGSGVAPSVWLYALTNLPM